MQAKDIKRRVIKRLKSNFPHWRRLTKKQKKVLAGQALADVMAQYNKEHAKHITLHELTNMPDAPPGIIPLHEMEKFIDNHKSNLLLFTKQSHHRCLIDQDLRLIDSLLDDRALNSLTAPPNYTPAMRQASPAQLFRAELLKALRYAEMSCRKYCRLMINKLENKTVRAFLHLPLHKKIRIHHSQLSQRRTDPTIAQMLNLMVYAAHLALQRIKLPHPFQICGVDSSDLASSCCPVPLATLAVGDKKVRIYSELDADCGKRRKKRNKSEYFVGCRLHTLVVLDPQTGRHYPLLSLAAPANHHDNLFLPQLAAFAKAMGLAIQVITADEAYGDAAQNKKIKQEHGVTVITTASQKVKTPEHVDPKRRQVFCDDYCGSPMRCLGSAESGHEFGCDAAPHECFRAPLCPQGREIPFDSGQFGQMPDIFKEADQIRLLRKHMERSYNLFKHRAGLERLRLKSQRSILAAATCAQPAAVLVEIAAPRRQAGKEKRPKQLPLAA
ncbi:MAG: transposase [Thermodesulfobacteriota bacterium]|nr:transposase [Thermodesulfobacteriota bacterium]